MAVRKSAHKIQLLRRENTGDSPLLYMLDTLPLELTPVQVAAYTIYIGVLHTPNDFHIERWGEFLF